MTSTSGGEPEFGTELTTGTQAARGTEFTPGHDPGGEAGSPPNNRIDQEQMRGAMSRLVGGVSVVTARRGSVDFAMTATSVVSVSLDPAVVLFTVYADSRFAELVGEGRPWAINIMGACGLAASEWLAEPGRPSLGQLDRIAHVRDEDSTVALLSEATAQLVCRTLWARGAGSHDVVTGGVERILLTGATGALIHHHGRIRRLDS